MIDIDITLWFTLGTLGMALGSVGLAYGFVTLSSDRHREYADVVVVTLIATVAYGLMALGIGEITTASGAELFVPRYVDWLLTTPLHVVFIALIAGAGRRLIAKAAALQAATIVLGFLGAVFATPLKELFFIAGSLAFVGVVYLLVIEAAKDAAERDDVTAGLYRKLRNFVIVLWLVYPIIWLLAPTGYGFMDNETASLVITYIDVVAKVGFGLIALNGLGTLETFDVADATGYGSGDD
ncbi:MULTISPECIES: bacteriorhodopsin [unclassified Halorhabdus]|uniref:bacteriorhodopsin n=1 Tax=unclassified Halorhabdus TaxID=2621901 RepID=UPI0023DB0009|nr:MULTISPECIES: bacteriorhodopsin [unclassified Halorhabdus]WEL17300.1 Bacteriorhodopsin [Halorhabdus sp. SVX81]WEL21183.1 Bacteriorhodopsin [Halorhabdus sp. BNX81]